MAQLADITICVDDDYQMSLGPAVARVLRRLRDTRRVRRVYPSMFHLATVIGRERYALDRWRTLEFHLEGLQALRYAHYYEILQRTPDTDQVLLTDVRDVLFQSDPFTPPAQQLEVFLEEPGLTIGSEPFNRRWIHNLYGADELAAIGGLTASCSGTVAGPRDAVLNYLKEMSEAIMTRRRPLGSHDQGVHNHLLRHDRFPHARIVPNGYGRVLTMGGMRQVRRDAEGRALNHDGTVPAVIHQYDRHPTIAGQLVTLLGSDTVLSSSPPG